jgi:hypothetical protein
MAFLTWNTRMGLRNQAVLLGVCFLLGAVVSFAASFYVTPDSPWRALVSLDDETLDSIGFRRRKAPRR